MFFKIYFLQPCSKFFKEKDVYFDGSFYKTNVYLVENLYTNDVINGPAIIIDKNR